MEPLINPIDTMVMVADAIARIAQAGDDGAVHEYLDLLAIDVRWEMQSAASSLIPGQVRVGHPDIRDGVQERRASKVQGPGSNTRHVVTSTVVTPGRGDRAGTATAVSYFRFYQNTSTEPRLASMGVYRDEFRLIDGRWLMSSRMIEIG